MFINDDAWCDVKVCKCGRMAEFGPCIFGIGYSAEDVKEVRNDGCKNDPEEIAKSLISNEEYQKRKTAMNALR